MCENCLRVNDKSVHLMVKRSWNNGNVKVFTEKCLREFLQFKWKSQTKVFTSLDFNKKISSSSSLCVARFLLLSRYITVFVVNPDYATIYMYVFLEPFVCRAFCLIQSLAVAWIEFIVITVFFSLLLSSSERIELNRSYYPKHRTNCIHFYYWWDDMFMMKHTFSDCVHAIGFSTQRTR